MHRPPDPGAAAKAETGPVLLVTRVVVTGSESTGKTTLAQQLAEHFQTLWVPEFGPGYVGLRFSLTLESLR